MLVSIVKKYWILGSLVIVMAPHPFLSLQVLAQSKTFVQPQPQILSQPEMLNLVTKLNISRRSNPKMTKLACKDNPSEPVYITRILTHETL
jgi:hypothetical protein